MISKMSSRNRVLVALIFCAVAFGIWRISRPQLSPEQQVKVVMDGVSQSVQNASPRGILQFLSPDFKWNNSSRAEVEKLIRQLCAGASRVELTRTNEKISVRGDEATVSGHYEIRFHTLQEASSEPAHSHGGDFTLLWQKIDGEWKIVALQGGENAPTSDSLF